MVEYYISLIFVLLNQIKTMKSVRVQYTVKKEYVEQNQKNIRQVMSDLKALNNPGIKYSSFLLEDGQTFMHFAMYPDDATSQIVNDLPAFVKFRTELKASQPEVPPKSDKLELVASAYDIF